VSTILVGCRLGKDFYPKLGEALQQQSGIDPEVHETGLYWLDLEDEDQALAWAHRHNRPLHRVAMEQVRAAVPSLGEGFSKAVYMPGVANVRNPRLLQSLRAALAKLPNVTIIEHCPVSGFVREGTRIVGVQTAQGEMRADQAVVAAAAWSGNLLATLGLELPVKPMKGQDDSVQVRAQTSCRAGSWPSGP